MMVYNLAEKERNENVVSLGMSGAQSDGLWTAEQTGKNSLFGEPRLSGCV